MLVPCKFHVPAGLLAISNPTGPSQGLLGNCNSPYNNSSKLSSWRHACAWTMHPHPPICSCLPRPPTRGSTPTAPDYSCSALRLPMSSKSVGRLLQVQHSTFNHHHTTYRHHGRIELPPQGLVEPHVAASQAGPNLPVLLHAALPPDIVLRRLLSTNHSPYTP